MATTEVAVEADRRQFSFRGPQELHDEVHAAATRDSLSFAEFCRRALWQAVANPTPDLVARIEEVEDRLRDLAAQSGAIGGPGWPD